MLRRKLFSREVDEKTAESYEMAISLAEQIDGDLKKLLNQISNLKNESFRSPELGKRQTGEEGFLDGAIELNQIAISSNVQTQKFLDRALSDRSNWEESEND